MHFSVIIFFKELTRERDILERWCKSWTWGLIFICLPLSYFIFYNCCYSSFYIIQNITVTIFHYPILYSFNYKEGRNKGTMSFKVYLEVYLAICILHHFYPTSNGLSLPQLNNFYVLINKYVKFKLNILSLEQTRSMMSSICLSWIHWI